VYIDESGKNTDLDRTHGYALTGEKVEGKTHGRKPEKLNIVAAKCGEMILEPHEYGCNMNSRFFEFWFMLLLLVVGKGYWFIMDNATFHRKTVLQKMAEAKGCRVLFLPRHCGLDPQHRILTKSSKSGLTSKLFCVITAESMSVPVTP